MCRLDGRIDSLGMYVLLSDYNFDEETRCKKHRKIKIEQGNDLSYNEFLNIYMSNNEPVLIDGLTENWKVRREWVNISNDNVNENSAIIEKPDLLKISHLFGEDVVPVHIQKGISFSQQFSSSTRTNRKVEMTVSEYAKWWYNNNADERNLENSNDIDILYLKDWKFVSNHAKYNLYHCPIYFKDDLLNETFDDAYRFCYIGPRGSCTFLHSDVFSSYSWSANICGLKRWYLIPPEFTFLVRDVFGQNLAPHLFHNFGLEYNTLFPGLSLVQHYAIHVLQKSHQTIFVPSEWHHTVENLQDTLSVNHNWINSTNVAWAWSKLYDQFQNTLMLNDDYQTSLSNNKQFHHQMEIFEHDLFLFWLMVSKNLKQDIKFFDKPNATRIRDISLQYNNVLSLLPILEGIESIINKNNEIYFRLDTTKLISYEISNLLIQSRKCLIKTNDDSGI